MWRKVNNGPRAQLARPLTLRDFLAGELADRQFALTAGDPHLFSPRRGETLTQSLRSTMATRELSTVDALDLCAKADEPINQVVVPALYVIRTTNYRLTTARSGLL